MPVWSFEELMNVRGDVISEAEATFHYAVVGGSARNFLVNFPSGNVISSVVADSLHWIFDGIRYPKEFKSVFDGYCRLISRDLGKWKFSTVSCDIIQMVTAIGLLRRWRSLPPTSKIIRKPQHL